MSRSSWRRTAHLRRLGAFAVVCTAGMGAALGFTGTASAAVPTEQTIDSDSSSVTNGTEVDFSGKLTGLGDQPIVGQQVRLQTRDGKGDSWSSKGTDKTDSKGSAAVSATVTHTAQWRLSYSGDGINDSSTSRAVTVQATKPMNERIVDSAADQSGKSYSYGANGPDSFDCSGLTQYVHKKVGIDLARTTSGQRGDLSRVAKSDMKRGDLVFIDSGKSPYHVGVYAGDNKMWAAPESGDVVHKQDIWTNDYSVGRAW